MLPNLADRSPFRVRRAASTLALALSIALLAGCGGAQGPDKNATINMSTLLRRRATLIGSSLRQRTPDQKGAIAARLLQEVWPKLPARSSIAPLIDSVHPLADVVEVHEYFDGGAHIGKIVLIP